MIAQSGRNSEFSLPLLGTMVDDPDVSVFESVEEAEAYIEIYDINDWRVYDAVGTVVSLRADGNRVKLQRTDRQKPDELKKLLRKHAGAAEIDVPPDADLAALVHAVRESDQQFRVSGQTNFAAVGGFFGAGIAIMGIAMLFIAWPLGIITLIFAFFFLRDWQRKRKLK